MRLQEAIRAAMLVVVATSAFVITGCGAGAGNSLKAGAITATTGRAQFTIRWPERSAGRLIPLASNSIRVRLTRGATPVAEKILARPSQGGTAAADFDLLAPGSFHISVAAHPGADGSGTAQAGAETDITVVGGQTTPVRMTMESAIDRLEISSAESGPLTIGNTCPFTAVAKNAGSEIVLTHPNNLTWNSQNTAVATVTTTGVVTAVSVGAATLEARETESGKAATFGINVVGAPPPPPPPPGDGRFYALMDNHTTGGNVGTVTFRVDGLPALG